MQAKTGAWGLARLGIVLGLSVALFFAHRSLQLQHYHHCKADLIRVVFYDQSTLCTHGATVLHVVEAAYHHLVKQVTTQVVHAISGGMGQAANLWGEAMSDMLSPTHHLTQ